MTDGWLDASIDWDLIHYFTPAGFLNLNGTFHNGTYLYHEYHPDGLL
jgi:hypothetical protein